MNKPNRLLRYTSIILVICDVMALLLSVTTGVLIMMVESTEGNKAAEMLAIVILVLAYAFGTATGFCGVQAKKLKLCGLFALLTILFSAVSFFYGMDSFEMSDLASLPVLNVILCILCLLGTGIQNSAEKKRTV